VAASYRRAAVILLNTVVLVILMEVVAATVLAFRPRVPTWAAMESPYFKERPWALDYWRELEVMVTRFQYQPYSLWRMVPFEGRFIRVRPDGLRVTPGATCDGVTYNVWAFGGSTMWGAGAPDDQTIPAHLQRTLTPILTRPVCVVNFAQLGFTSTQAVVELQNELRHRRRPNLVIFYDGVNDIVSAFAYSRAGLHLAYPEIRRRLESQQLDAPRPPLVDLLRWSSQYRLITQLLSKPVTAPANAARPDSLVEDVVATYLENVRIVVALAGAYGFRAIFFWQPTLAEGEKPLTAIEREIRDREPLVPFARRVDARLRHVTPGVHNLADVFARTSSLTYFDWHHTTPEANRIIAEAIAQAVSK